MSILIKLYLEEFKFWDLVLNLQQPEIADRDYIENKDPEWDSLARAWIHLNECLVVLEEKEKRCRATLILRTAG